MNRISKLRSQMLLKQPFFGAILMAFPLVERYDIPTAATDMRKIYYNPSFFDQLTDRQIIFVLAHEVLHIAFKHGVRCKGRNRKLANIAMDYAINWILQKLGFDLIPGVLIDPQYADMSWEHIYDLLQQEQEESAKQRSQSGDPDGDGDEDGAAGGGQPGEGEGSQPCDGKSKAPLSGDVEEPDGMSAAEESKLDQRINQQVASASNMARMAGKMPANLERVIQEILMPDAPIEEVLRQYMTEVTRDDESWSRRNRRFGSVYLPARHNEAMGEVVMIGDTSGSVTQRDLSLIAGMVTRISENMNPERIRMIWADTQVAGEQVFERGDAIEFHPMGYGGTDMRVPLEHAEQFNPVVVVLVTDGYTPWPDVPPGYPLIVCCTTDTDVPIGEVIRI